MILKAKHMWSQVKPGETKKGFSRQTTLLGMILLSDTDFYPVWELDPVN